MGGRSPMAMASPVNPVEARRRHRHVGDRHLPWADHRIARDEPTDCAVANRDEERLVRDRREAQNAQSSASSTSIRRWRMARLAPLRRVARRASSSAACRASRRAGTSTGALPKCASVATRSVGSLAPARAPRTDSARDRKMARNASSRSAGSRARIAPAPRCTRARAGSSELAARDGPQVDARASARSRARAPASRSRGRPAPTS